MDDRSSAGDRDEAAARELREETGVEAEILGLVDVVDGVMTTRHYIMIDYAARWIAGEPVAELPGQPVQGVALGHYSCPWPSADSGSGGRFPVFS